MTCPDTDLLHSLSAELSQRLKNLMDQALLGFIRPNSVSQFAQHASELANFRKAMAQKNSNGDIEFLRSFREFIPTTNYDPYRPFIAKFFATPCKESDVQNMFAPGLPYCLAVSSTTSGKAPKTFPIYQPAPHLLHHPLYLSLRHSEGSILSPSSLSFGQALKMYFEDGHSSKVLPVCSVTVGFLRMQMNWHVEHDKDRIDLWGKRSLCFRMCMLISRQLSVPGKTDPYAISLVKSYHAFFILDALFALADRRVTTIRFLFASVFVNFLQYVEDEWPLLIDCIEKGIIPDMENLDHFRESLEVIYV